MPEAVQAELPIAPAAPAAAPQAPETTTESAPQSEAPVTKPTGEAPEKPETEKSGKSRFERRLDKAYRRAAEAEARAQLYERQLQEVRTPKDDAAPKLEQFNDIEKYADAKAQYESDKRVKALQSQQQSQNAKQLETKIVSEWEERVSQAKQEDFDEIVGDLKPVTPLNVAIMHANPDVAYYLGKNEKEIQRIAGLHPIAQILEIGRLEAKLTAEPVKPKPSKAPAPIEPVGGESKSSGEPDPGNTKAWIAWRQKQVHGKPR